MALRYRSRVPKKRDLDGLEAALMMIFFPIAIFFALLGTGKKNRRRKRR